MKGLTAVIGVTILLAGLAPAGAEAQNGMPTATAVAPGGSIVATHGPVTLDVRVALPGGLLDDFTAGGRVTTSPTAPTSIDLFPLTPVPGDPGHYTGTMSDGRNDDSWAAVPGTYYWATELFPIDRGPSCRPLPTGEMACATASLALLRETVAHPIVVVAALDAAAARSRARRAARAIGWRSAAPLRCVAPFAPSAWACTFTWHRAGKEVRRTLTVAQDATGRVSFTR